MLQYICVGVEVDFPQNLELHSDTPPQLESIILLLSSSNTVTNVVLRQGFTPSVFHPHNFTMTFHAATILTLFSMYLMCMQGTATTTTFYDSVLVPEYQAGLGRH